jgi:hypothetical protein
VGQGRCAGSPRWSWSRGHSPKRGWSFIHYSAELCRREFRHCNGIESGTRITPPVDLCARYRTFKRRGGSLCNAADASTRPRRPAGGTTTPSLDADDGRLQSSERILRGLRARVDRAVNYLSMMSSFRMHAASACFLGLPAGTSRQKRRADHGVALRRRWRADIEHRAHGRAAPLNEAPAAQGARVATERRPDEVRDLAARELVQLRHVREQLAREHRADARNAFSVEEVGPRALHKSCNEGLTATFANQLLCT